LIRRHVDDPLLQNTISLLSGYAAYYPADALHLSGVLSAIAAGLFLGRQTYSITSASSRVQITAMREITLFLINGLLFILVGLQLRPILVGLSGAESPGALIAMAAAVSLTVILVRLLWAFPAAYLPAALSPKIRAAEGRPSWRNVLVVAWTGLRGGISLAAALAVPLTIANGAPFPHRDLILFLTFSVILATLVGQGLTLPVLIRKLGLTAESPEREEALARLRATRAARDALERLAVQPWADPEIVRDVREHLRKAAAHHRATRDQTLTSEQTRSAATAQRIRHELNEAQSREIVRLRDEGAINDETVRKIQRELDLEAVRDGS
jgi:NhaP-type Na+/H+ or K+/H+ antiporter